ETCLDRLSRSRFGCIRRAAAIELRLESRQADRDGCPRESHSSQEPAARKRLIRGEHEWPRLNVGQLRNQGRWWAQPTLRLASLQEQIRSHQGDDQLPETVAGTTEFFKQFIDHRLIAGGLFAAKSVAKELFHDALLAGVAVCQEAAELFGAG